MVSFIILEISIKQQAGKNTSAYRKIEV